jgi:glycosyltransferase involved in cell wall biosynthesis
MTLSCIIPAWNEGPRIAAVLRIVASHPLVAETIVVDDGSTDDTAAIAAAIPGVRVLRLARNGGKTAAVARGIAAARGSVVMLVDADLAGLTGRDVWALAAPVLAGAADMTISLRGNAPRLWHALGVDYISGERVFRRDLIAPHLADLDALPRFGLEVFLNRLFLAGPGRVAIIDWSGVTSRAKAAKRGLLPGLAADAGMLRDILRAVGTREILRQILGLRQRRVALPPVRPAIAAQPGPSIPFNS